MIRAIKLEILFLLILSFFGLDALASDPVIAEACRNLAKTIQSMKQISGERVRCGRSTFVGWRPKETSFVCALALKVAGRDPIVVEWAERKPNWINYPDRSDLAVLGGIGLDDIEGFSCEVPSEHENCNPVYIGHLETYFANNCL